MESPILLTLVLVFLGLMLSLQLWTRLRLRRQRGKFLPQLWQLIQTQAPGQDRVLVYVWSPSCGQCRATTPIINDLKLDYPNVVSIDASEHTAAVVEAGVMGTPAFLTLVDGVLQQAWLGARSAQQIHQLLLAL